MSEEININWRTQYKDDIDYDSLVADIESNIEAMDNGVFVPSVPIIHSNMTTEERIADMEKKFKDGKVFSFDYPGGFEKWKADLRSGEYGKKKV